MKNLNTVNLFKTAWTKSFLAFVLVVSLVVPYLPQTASAAPVSVATDLIISEYIEGSSNNKAIEIYNGTGADVDLSAYKIELYINGQTTVNNTENLTGTLANGSTYVYYNTSATADFKPVNGKSSSVANFNGDDTLLLKKGDTLVDSFGQLGNDPGTNWSANGVATSEITLVRKEPIV